MKSKSNLYRAGIFLLVVVGAVMSAGFGELGRELFPTGDSGVYMLAAILPMCAVMMLVIFISNRHIRKKTEPLINALKEVGKGKLDIVLDTENGGEYADVYETFNLMTKELTATKKEMDSFVNTFAHEFKTPITSISGFADLLYETGTDIENEERMEYLKLIADQSRRLARLSQNTLLLSKLEAAQIVTGSESYSLSKQIERCAMLFINELDKRNIELSCPENIELIRKGDPELTEHIWINLIGNALKFTPDNGRIDITYLQDSSSVTVSISDSGCGMSDETLSHIFEKYYQHDIISIVKGNGIGLAIVKRAAELSGGSVTVTSELNKGSTFTITLPK